MLLKIMLQDGGGIGWGDHFLFKNSSKEQQNGEQFTKQRLIASSGYQAPRKAAHCLRREGKKFVFLFSFLSFILLVFLSYFLLKSSNTPLLFLNFHFHLNITLQKKKEKK